MIIQQWDENFRVSDESDLNQRIKKVPVRRESTLLTNSSNDLHVHLAGFSVLRVD